MDATAILGAMLVAIGMNSQNVEKVKDKEIICWTDNVYWEARGESRTGKEAAAYTTLHRVIAPGYPQSFCDVVWEKRKSKKSNKLVPMFSWTLDGKSDDIPSDQAAVWEECLKVVLDVMLRRVPDPTESIGGATHFYNHNLVAPSWAAEASGNVKIGNHTFVKLDSY